MFVKLSVMFSFLEFLILNVYFHFRLHPVNSLLKHMKKRAKARELEREAAGGGDIFFMRKPEDISGQDGEIVLFEYMEEHPPLLSLVGMCSKVDFYHCRKTERFIET